YTDEKCRRDFPYHETQAHYTRKLFLPTCDSEMIEGCEFARCGRVTPCFLSGPTPRTHGPNMQRPSSFRCSAINYVNHRARSDPWGGRRAALAQAGLRR